MTKELTKIKTEKQRIIELMKKHVLFCPDCGLVIQLYIWKDETWAICGSGCQNIKLKEK